MGKKFALRIFTHYKLIKNTSVKMFEYEQKLEVKQPPAGGGGALLALAILTRTALAASGLPRASSERGDSTHTSGW